ncbi:MAG: dTDP-4-dehydrorhamnose 3,5-epimerase [Salibacteraceae bacterium]
MNLVETSISGLLVIEPTIFSDDRGYFFESFRLSALAEHGIKVGFVQDNESKSNRGALRGLHLQAPPYAQAKLLRVVTGSIYDVAVDVRSDSPTYGKYFGLELSGENKKTLYIPEGFAHGFCCLENNTIVQYKCSNYYQPKSEMGLKWNDKNLGINWPDIDFIISEKDEQHPPLSDFNTPF